MPTKDKKEDLRTYLLEFKNGHKKKVTVPANWKVTFGPVAQRAANSNSPKTYPVALRFYEDETRQRAIFTDVMNFRDLSIPVLEERVEVKDKYGSLDIDGARKNVSVRAETREWVDPDSEEVNHSKLLDDTSIDLD